MSTRFGLIFALWGAGLGAASQYAKVSVVFDRLPEVYPDAGAALGFVVSLVGLVGILFGAVAGIAVARLGYRRAVILGLWGGAAVSALQIALPPLPLFLALRAAEGVSHLMMVVAIPTLIAQLSAPQHRGFTLTLWSTFFGVAFSLLVAFGLPLVDVYGIPALFAAHTLWFIVFALGLMRVLPPDAPRDANARKLTLRDVVAQHGTIYRSPFIAAPAVGWLFYTLCFLALLTVLPPYIPDGARAATLAAMPLVSIAVSMTVGVAALRVFSAIQVVMLGFALSIITFAWLLAVPGAPAACIALAAALGLIQGASFAAVPELNADDADKAAANGAMAQMGNLGNTLGTPMMLLILTYIGYSGMFWVASVIFAGAIVAHLLLARRRAAVSA